MAKKDKYDIHKANDDFTRAYSPVYKGRKVCAEDRRFYCIPGAMWEGEYGEQWGARPKPEFNKTEQSIMRLVSEYRNNRIEVKFLPDDENADDETADTLNGMYRADSHDSKAQEARDNAFEEAVSGGFGAWRLRVEKNDEYSDDDRMRIKMEPIIEADKYVFFDPGSRFRDKSDARYCFVITPVTRQGFAEEYGDDKAASVVSFTFPDTTQESFDWATAEFIYIAEHFFIVIEEYERVVLIGALDDEIKIDASDYDDDDIMRASYAAQGYEEARREKRKRKIVKKSVISGGEVLEDPQVIAGTRIPIIPAFGKRRVIDNVEHCSGHVRVAKDPQRLLNSQLAAITHISSLSPRRKPIFTPEQVVGHEDEWAMDNQADYPFMLINQTLDANNNPLPNAPMGYTEPPNIPEATARLLDFSTAILQDIMGANEKTDDLRAGVSGVALEKIHSRIDMNTYVYTDNMSEAIRCEGEVYLSMAREAYGEAGTKVKTMGERGESSFAEIGIEKVDTDGKLRKINDPNNGIYRATVSSGPSTETQRKALVHSLLETLQVTQDPEARKLLEWIILYNIEGEGLGDYRAFVRKKLLDMGILQPNDEERAEMQQAAENRQPDPNAEFLKAESEKSLADAELKRAKTLREMAETEKTLAETQEISVGIPITQIRAVADIEEKRVNADVLTRQRNSININE